MEERSRRDYPCGDYDKAHRSNVKRRNNVDVSTGNCVANLKRRGSGGPRAASYFPGGAWMFSKVMSPSELAEPAFTPSTSLKSRLPPERITSMSTA